MTDAAKAMPRVSVVMTTTVKPRSFNNVRAAIRQSERNSIFRHLVHQTNQIGGFFPYFRIGAADYADYAELEMLGARRGIGSDNKRNHRGGDGGAPPTRAWLSRINLSTRDDP